MKKAILVLLTLILVSSCKRENDVNVAKEVNPHCEKFAEGEVLLGINSNIEIEQLFTNINLLKLEIDQVKYLYTTTIGKDSIPYIINVLNTKPYINARQFGASAWAHYQTGTVHISNYLWDMTESNQQDFILTKNLLKMQDKFSDTKSMLVKVPVGQEIFWVDKFKTLSWVTWSELNCIGQIRLHQ